MRINIVACSLLNRYCRFRKHCNKISLSHSETCWLPQFPFRVCKQVCKGCLIPQHPICDARTHPHVPGRNRHPEEELGPKSYGRVHMEDLKWTLCVCLKLLCAFCTGTDPTAPLKGRALGPRPSPRHTLTIMACILVPPQSCRGPVWQPCRNFQVIPSLPSGKTKKT